MASHQDSPLNSPTSTSPIKLVLDSPTWFGGTPTSYGNSSQDRDGPLTPAVAIKLLPGDFRVAGGMLNCAGKPRLPLGWTCGLRPQRQSCFGPHLDTSRWGADTGGGTKCEETPVPRALRTPEPGLLLSGSELPLYSCSGSYFSSSPSRWSILEPKSIKHMVRAPNWGPYSSSSSTSESEMRADSHMKLQVRGGGTPANRAVCLPICELKTTHGFHLILSFNNPKGT